MGFEIRRELIRGVNVEEDPVTGKLNLTLELDPARLDKEAIEYLRKLSGRPVTEVARILGAKSVDNIAYKLNHQTHTDLDELSHKLEAAKHNPKNP
jgi:hypothetical protein